MSLQCVFAFFVGAAAGAVPPPGAEIGRDVDEAIDAGIHYLLKEVEGPGGWTPAEKFPAGYAGVQVYALVKSDVSFQHPVVQKGLAIVECAPFEHVYSVSLDLMAHGAILEQIEARSKATRRVASDRPPPGAARSRPADSSPGCARADASRPPIRRGGRRTGPGESGGGRVRRRRAP